MMKHYICIALSCSPLSPGKKNDSTGESSSAMNYDDSYNSDEDDEINSSSDSDEERYVIILPQLTTPEENLFLYLTS